jgi:hypothetical protein
MVSVWLLPLLALSLTQTAKNACSLVTKAEASSVLGKPISAATAAPPAPDEDSKGILSYCTYRAEGAAVVVSLVTFPSASAAERAVTKEFIRERLEGDTATIETETGLGDRAFWAYTESGAEYVVVRGSSVVGVIVGGRGLKPAAGYKSELRKAVAAAVSRL